MIINNNEEMTNSKFGSKMYQALLGTICKDINHCKKKNELLKQSQALFEITIDERDNGSPDAKDAKSNSLVLESQKFFQINSDSKVDHKIEKIYDIETQMINVIPNW